jgi:hypothetical protein
VGDGLALMIKHASEQRLISGLVPHLVEGALNILQYADDTNLFYGRYSGNARNTEYILCLFEQISGLKINFHKRDIYCLWRLLQGRKNTVKFSLVLLQKYP